MPRRAATLVIVMLSLGLCACADPVQYEMRQPISMGPFTYSITSARQGKSWQSADGPFREIEVRIRVELDETAPFTDSFTSYFLGRLHIVDAAGNRIGADPQMISPTYRAGRARSDEYLCVFRSSRSHDGVKDFDAIGTTPKDFRLLIDHPAPTGDEPRRAAVQLG